MNTWIALLRGINVGGNNILPMAELRALLNTMACENVKTYIQSGNAVFNASSNCATSLATLIKTKIAQSFDFEPAVFCLLAPQLETILTANPFSNSSVDAKNIHIYFLAKPVTQPNLEALNAVRKENEVFELTEQAFYLLAPDGIGRSKLAASVEKHLGTPVTARNLRSAVKIFEMTKA